MRRIALGLLLALSLRGEVAVYRNFTLIDGVGGAPLPGAGMIVKDGRIVWIGRASRMNVPSGADVQELAGKFVMPGLINLHAHVAAGTVPESDPRKYFTLENVKESLKLYARYGVTSVVSMGTDQPLVWEFREHQRNSRPTEARIFTAGRGFTTKNGFPITILGVPYEVETREQVVADVDELAVHHPDLVKIWVDDRLGRDPKLPIAMSAAIIERAHMRGLKVAAHMFYLQDAKELVKAGLDTFAHSVRDKPVDDELIQLMKRHGTWQIATLSRDASTFEYGSPSPVLNDPLFMRAVSSNVLATLRTPQNQKRIASDPDFQQYPQFLETAKQNLKRLSDAGVRIGFGTDSGPPMRYAGYAEHWEARLMVDAGLTPMQVILSATKNAAEYLGASKDLGTLQKGRWADFLVLTANPLARIQNLSAIESVYIAGHRVN